MPRSVEHVDQLAQRVLRLGDGQAVAGHDDHPVGVRRAGSRRPRGWPSAPAGRRPRRRPSVEPPLSAPNRMLATERPIALAISRVRNVPDAPTSVPATSSSDVAEHVAAGRDRQAGERVEQRDDDRHVGAADRQHEQHAERAGRARPSTMPTPASSGRGDQHDREPTRAERARAAEERSAGPGRPPAAWSSAPAAWRR